MITEKRIFITPDGRIFDNLGDAQVHEQRVSVERHGKERWGYPGAMKEMRKAALSPHEPASDSHHGLTKTGPTGGTPTWMKTS